MENKCNIPSVTTEVNELAADLNRVSRNLWWTWTNEAQEVFQSLSPRTWQNLYHNAVAVLHEVSDYELRTRLRDPQFAGRVQAVTAADVAGAARDLLHPGRAAIVLLGPAEALRPQFEDLGEITVVDP